MTSGSPAPAPSVREHPHYAMAEDLWSAVSSGDASRLRRILSPNIRWHSYGAGDLSGTFVGADAVLDLLASTGEMVDQLASTLIDISVSDRGAVLRYEVEAQRGSKKLHVEHLAILEIRADRIVETITVPVDQDENDRFWDTSKDRAAARTLRGNGEHR